MGVTDLVLQLKALKTKLKGVLKGHTTAMILPWYCYGIVSAILSRPARIVTKNTIISTAKIFALCMNHCLPSLNTCWEIGGFPHLIWEKLTGF